MAKYSKAAREAFNEHKARQAAYWLEHLEDSFRSPFSWTNNIKGSKYRRSAKPANVQQ